MPYYSTLQDAIDHLEVYREQLIDQAKIGKLAAGPSPNWLQAEAVSYSELPRGSAAKAVMHLDNARVYGALGEPGAAAFHLGQALGVMKS